MKRKFGRIPLLCSNCSGVTLKAYCVAEEDDFDVKISFSKGEAVCDTCGQKVAIFGGSIRMMVSSEGMAIQATDEPMHDITDDDACREFFDGPHSLG